MTILTRLPAVETPALVLREIEPRDAGPFCNFMMQEAYQRHIAVKLASPAEVKTFVKRAVARQGDERRSAYHLAAEEKLRIGWPFCSSWPCTNTIEFVSRTMRPVA